MHHIALLLRLAYHVEEKGGSRGVIFINVSRIFVIYHRQCCFVSVRFVGLLQEIVVYVHLENPVVVKDVCVARESFRVGALVRQTDIP